MLEDSATVIESVSSSGNDSRALYMREEYYSKKKAVPVTANGAAETETDDEE